MAGPTRENYDGDEYYYDNDLDQVRSYNGEEAYDANTGEPIYNYDD